MWFWMAAALAGGGVVDAVEAFVRAGDGRDLEALEQVLHDDFRVVAQMPSGVSVIDRASYLGLVRGEKIGGEAREQQVHAVMESGDLATVKGSLQSATAAFDCTWSLVKVDGAWRVVQDLVVFRPKG